MNSIRRAAGLKRNETPKSGRSHRYGLRFAVVNAVAALAAFAAWAGDAPRIVVVGDSLSAGYGLPPGQSFPAQLQGALDARGVKGEIVNAGVSGDTTAGGLARLDWVLKDKPDAVILELGANDGLRALDPAQTYANLDRIMSRLEAAKIPVLLAGMKAPANLGREYGAEFEAMYPRLAERHHAELYPFFLDGAAADPALNQADGIHPNAQGVGVIVGKMLPYVLRLIGASG
jgi:acyl-CoA thioesterase-1